MSRFARKVERAQQRKVMKEKSSESRSDKARRRISEFNTPPRAMLPGENRKGRRQIATEMRKKASGRKS